jgi:two-component system sensor histidine kinase UhpB
MFIRNALSRLQVQRALIAGLCLFAVLLLSAVVIAWRTIHHIDDHTQQFAARQAAAKQSIVKIEQQQSELNSRWLKLAKKKDVVSREEILAQTEQNREDMAVALEDAYEQSEFLRESIYAEGHGLLRWTTWLFGACVLLSIACASWAVQASTQLFKRLELLQYQFLETQENTARRFSHELHDELGQALAAVKANLSALRSGAGSESSASRVDDCMLLVDHAIQDVREMSQLLRPTILDDFGLDAALRVLTEGFARRTGLELKYESDLGGQRLKDETESNLYRIAQEALTNVARHSEASSVQVSLVRQSLHVVLAIRDNGKGMDLTTKRTQTGLGFAGMQTRARGCGGSLRIDSTPGKGLRVEVTCPIAQ